MTILTLLQQLLGPYKKFSNGENYFACPFCHHPKKKFAINEHSLKFHCWHCNSRGNHIIWLLKQINVSPEILKQFKELLSDTNISRITKTVSNMQLYLPFEYKPLWIPTKTYEYNHAINYIKLRQFSSDEILRYRIGYCETGAYAHRIIIPSYDKNNQLNYFTARSYFEGSMKYKNPPVTKNIVCFENMINWEEPIILCEGMFDAIALKRNAIPLLGKTVSKAVEHSLLKHNVKNVIIFLDKDARSDAIKLEQRLNQYDMNVSVVLTDEKDASEMGFEKSWERINTAQTTTFKQFIAQRLLNV